MTTPALKLIFAFLLISIVTGADGFSQNGRDFQLFDYPDRDEAMARMTGAAPERAFIRPDEGLSVYGTLRGGDLLHFEIKGTDRVYRVERVSEHIRNTHSIQAVNPDDPRDYLLLTFEEGRVNGMLHTDDHSKLYQFGYDREEEMSFIIEVDPSVMHDFECAVDPELHSTSRFEPQEQMGRSISKPEPSAPLHMDALAASLTDEITIDLMIVYTPAAKEWADNHSDEGSMNSVISASINLAQQIFDNSNTYVRLRLVHAHETDYDESAGNPSMSDHLRRFAAAPGNNPFGSEFNGYMEEVHSIRNEVGADLMILLADVAVPGGIGFLLNQIGGAPDLAFSLTNVRFASRFSVFTHEIGHNMGAAHARNQDENPADQLGGVFEYSTGYRFQSGNNFYATIMAYAQGNDSVIPYFSNPDQRSFGISQGTYNRPTGPSDNTRTFRQTKRVVAGYRPTRVNPPVAELSGTSLSVNMDQEDTFRIPVIITNSGSSDLMYEIDFSMQDLPTRFREEPSRMARETPLSVGSYPGRPADPAAVSSGSADASEAEIYATTFSTGEGFETGVFSGIERWRTFTTDQEFEISSENPSAGSTHLRISDTPSDTSAVFVRSPWFGPQPFGSYEFSADIYIEGDERLDLYISDSRAGNVFSDMTAGAIFTGGNIFTRGLNNNGQPDFTSQGQHTYQSDQYFSFRVVSNPSGGTIRYFYNDTHFVTRPYTSGTTFGSFMIIHGNSGAGNRIDIDNVKVRRNHAPFSWLASDSYGGVIRPGSSEEAELTFSTRGIESGTYEGIMIIRTNEGDTGRYEIPIMLSVSGEIARSDGVALQQNYPNPFSAAVSTTIGYSLPDDSHVRVDIYSVNGRRVKTIVNEMKAAGSHEIPFHASGLASGIYIYQIRTDFGSESKKMVLIN